MTPSAPTHRRNGSGSNTPHRSKRQQHHRWTHETVVALAKVLCLLFLGYYAGSLQSSHHVASSLSNAVDGSGDGSGAYLSPQRPMQQQRRQKSEQRISPLLTGQGTGILEAIPSKPVQNEPRHAICRRLAGGRNASDVAAPSALDLWFRHYATLHKASQLSTNDVKYSFHDFTAELMRLISPRLPQSTVALPKGRQLQQTLQPILTKLERRLEYLQNEKSGNQGLSSPPPPPVQIVVLGGSVLVGRNCRKLLKDLGLQFVLPNRECTYSHRLQLFLDQVTYLLLHGHNSDLPKGQRPSPLTPQLFQVHKIAMGGTNTAVGTQIFKYDLLSEEARRPDIVINGYATNDMHVLTVMELQESNKTLRDGVFEMLQDFVRTILQQDENEACDEEDGEHPGWRAPLLIHVDDYLGNEQRQILQTMELSQSVSVLAQYYGFGAVSYANLVRDWVYGNTHEYWFSPEGWWQTFEHSQGGSVQTTAHETMQREIHPNMGMHIVTPWILAYNMLQITTAYCSLEPYLEDLDDSGSRELRKYELSPWAAKFVRLRNDVKEVPGRPQAVPRGLPPRLTPELSLENVSEHWWSSGTEGKEHNQRNPGGRRQRCSDQSRHQKCPFSWVGGLSLQQNNKTWIQDLFEAHTPTKSMVRDNRSGKKGETSSSSLPWTLVDESGKVGFVASPEHPLWVLEFRSSSTRSIRTVTFFYLKSYGDKWESSRVHVLAQQLASDNTNKEMHQMGLASIDLIGSHAKNTSEMYTHELVLLNDNNASSSKRRRVQDSNLKTDHLLRLVLELQGGTTFKLMGLAVCH